MGSIIGAPEAVKEPEVPHNGWDVTLIRNTFLGEQVPILKPSGVVITPDKMQAENKDEFHMVVHRIAPTLDEAFRLPALKVGVRVSISGRPTPLRINGREFWVCDIGSIRAILGRVDEGLFVGSRYGEKGLPKPKEASAK